MPPKAPKPKESLKKTPTAIIVRQEISSSSLMYIPEDVIEGFDRRLESDIDWTLLACGVRKHKARCKREDMQKLTFSEALKNKLSKSIAKGFLDEDSGLTMEKQLDLLPATLWDIEKFATEEAKICFHNDNCITDDLVAVIKRAVKKGDRNSLKDSMKMVKVLRVNDSKMSELDKGLAEYKKLISLNLSGNFLDDINTGFIPPSVKSLELQSNCFSDVSKFSENLPIELLYLGLSKNFLTSETIEGIALLPFKLTVLDLSDNDIYHLDPVLGAVSRLPNLSGLQLSGNPCSVCAGYSLATLTRLPRLRWLDCREILESDRPQTPTEIQPDDLRSAYFHFTVFRVMATPQPPTVEKGVVTSFHIELELPFLDVVRRKFLMYRRNESLIEFLPPPEDELLWPAASQPVVSKLVPSLEDASSLVSDIYTNLAPKNTREIHNFTTFESNKVQWNKIMNFQEPTLKIFCPDLIGLRNTFQTVITVRLIYTVTHGAQKPAKQQKSLVTMPTPGDLSVTLATIRCALKNPDWSQPSQHFHWDDNLGTNDALHWGDADLSVIQYNQSESTKKAPKGKTEPVETNSREVIPDNLTCHFGFGIDTLL